MSPWSRAGAFLIYDSLARRRIDAPSVVLEVFDARLIKDPRQG